MQDKALDAMAKKYKEEMMRLYAGKPTAQSRPAAPEMPRVETANEVSPKPREQAADRDADRLMHPPMPQIPNISAKCGESVTENAQSKKFPSPEEIMAEHTPRFDNITPQAEQEQEHALDQRQGHEQGNYEFTEAEQERTFEGGEGCLKLEVSGGGEPLDCALAALFRVTDSGDVLTATFFTDQKGETEVITLPVLGLDEKYTVTVAKEGFFTVRDLEIPIFDSIKSIQPVELKREKTE